MRSFFPGAGAAGVVVEASSESEYAGAGTASARIAVYDSPVAAPRVVDVSAHGTLEFIDELSSSIYNLAREAGGSLPYTALREIVENLVHAHFTEPVVTIMDGGDTVRVSDQGPGITDKQRALLPGYTTASSGMKRYIRGVGSGLPLVQECLLSAGGSMSIEDNLGGGTVITLTRTAPVVRPAAMPRRATVSVGAPQGSLLSSPPSFAPSTRAHTPLTSRQKRVLALVMEQGSIGPSVVAKELDIAVSTAHRDLAVLESMGLIAPSAGGKRALTDYGMSAADGLLF